MDRPQQQTTDSQVAYGVSVYTALLRRKGLNTNLKVAWFALLQMSYYRFRLPLGLNPADLAAAVGLSQAQALRYLKALAAARLIHVYKTPDGKSRLPGANYWPCCLLDPFTDLDEQIKLVDAGPQFWLELDAGADHADVDPAAADGSAEAGSMEGATSAPTLPFKRSGQEAPLTEAAAPDRPTPGRPTTTADGTRSQLRAAAVHPPRGPAAKLATTPPQVCPPRLAPSRDLSLEALSLSPNRPAIKTRPAAQGAPPSSGVSGARSAADQSPKPIGGALADRLAGYLAIDPTDRFQKIQNFAAAFVDAVADPACRVDPKIAHAVATAVVDGNLPTERVHKIFTDRARRAGTPRGVDSPFGYVLGCLRNAFRDARLDWKTGRKLPD